MPTDNPSRFRSQECQDGPVASDETYLSLDVRAWAAREVPRASTGRWGVGGYSTGAYCAFLLQLHRPQDYAAAAGVDGYYHAIDTLFARGLYANEEQRLADSPDWLWEHAPPALPVELLVMQGTRDEDYGHAQAFRRELVASAPHGLTLVSIDNPSAEHTARSWRLFDPVMVAWLGRTLAADAASPPVRYPPLPLHQLVVNPLGLGADLLGGSVPVRPAKNAALRPCAPLVTAVPSPRASASPRARPSPRRATPAPRRAAVPELCHVRPAAGLTRPRSSPTPRR
jgi:hypothetical protein